MIHLVIGGCCAGKTTFVKKHFLGSASGFREDRIGGVPLSISPFYCAVGHYDKPTRTLGVDQMGWNTKQVQGKLLDFMGSHAVLFSELVMEGNVITDVRFIDQIKTPIKLWFINPPSNVVAHRLKALKIKYGPSIITLSYRRAFAVWERYRREVPCELITE